MSRKGKTSRGRASLLLGLTLSVTLMLLASAGCRSKARKELVADNYRLFEQAQKALADRNYELARRRLGDIGLVTPIEDGLDPRLKLALADAYFFQPGVVNTVEAQHRYERFLSFYPLDPKASYARYQVGACLFRQSESPENDQEYTFRALRHFQAMVNELATEDPWRRAALVMVHKAQDKLAAHEWQVAMFYKKRDARVGMLRRLEHLVDGYPNSRYRERAFLELAQGYLAASDPEKARLSLDRLLSEYPAGELRDAATRLKEQVSTQLEMAASGAAG